MNVNGTFWISSTTVVVTATVTNTGARPGKEVVQLYLGDPSASLQRPPRELKGFAKLELAPGESRTASFRLEERDFAFFHPRYEQWLAESGEFELMIGASSRDIRLSGRVEFASTRKLHYRLDEYSFVSDLWKEPALRPLVIEFIPRWLSNFAREDQPLDEVSIHPFLAEQPLVKMPMITGGEVTDAQVRDLLERANRLTFTP